MKKGWMRAALVAVLVALSVTIAACGKRQTPAPYDYGDPIERVDPVIPADTNAAGLEALSEKNIFYKPALGGVGDVMPYYEDGVYHLYYLREGGGSNAHPVAHAVTTDFLSYYDRGIALDAGTSNDPDAMIGTGSVVKAAGEYYFFYTGHPADQSSTTPEVVLAAKGGTPDTFVKTDFRLDPPAELNDNGNFRDPEVTFDEATETFHILVSARKDGKAVVAHFTAPKDLSSTTYEGIVYTVDRGAFVYMLECVDVFPLNGRWYLTYSAQDLSEGDTNTMLKGAEGRMYYAVGNSPFGPFTEPYDNALDSMVFYAGKTAQAGEDTYMAGWARGKKSNADYSYEWGGNMVVHQVVAGSDGRLRFQMPSAYRDYFTETKPLAIPASLGSADNIDMLHENGGVRVIGDESPAYMLSFDVTFDDETAYFGAAFAVGSFDAGIARVTLVPSADKLRLSVGNRPESASRSAALTAGETHRIDIVVEGSVLTTYVDGLPMTGRVRGIGNKKIGLFAKDGSVVFSNIVMRTPGAGGRNNAASKLEIRQGESYGTAEILSTQNGIEYGQSVRAGSLTVAPGADVYYTAPAPGWRYMRASLIASVSGEATASVYNGDRIVKTFALTDAPKAYSADALVAEGSRLTVAFSGSGTIETELSITTDHIPQPQELAYLEGVDRGVAYTAPSDGVLGFAAASTAGAVIATIDEQAAAWGAGLWGEIYLTAGQTLRLLPMGEVTGGYRLCAGFYRGSRSGILRGTAVTPDRSAKAEPPAPGFTPVGRPSEGNSADAFGSEGAKGFLYTFGKALDEMQALDNLIAIPKPDVETPSRPEDFDYEYRSDEAADLLVKADWAKYGGGYMAGVVFVAPADRTVRVTLTFRKTEGDAALVQLAHGPRLVGVRVTTDDAEVRLTAELQVRAGDTLRAGFKALDPAGTAVGAGNYRLTVEDYGEAARKKVSTYAVDLQGRNGWYFHTGTFSFEGGEKLTAYSELPYAEGAYETDGLRIDAEGVGARARNSAGSVWNDLTVISFLAAADGRYALEGTLRMPALPEGVDESRMAFRLMHRKRDGSQTKVADGFGIGRIGSDDVRSIQTGTLTMAAGEWLHLVLFTETAADPQVNRIKLEMNVFSASGAVPDYAERVTLDKAQVTIQDDESFDLFSTVIGASQKVTYSSSDPTVATVDAAGHVEGVSPGTATVTATTVGGKTAACTVTVTPAPKITLDRDTLTLTLKEGETVSAELAATIENVSGRGAVWRSSNESIATVDAFGKVTAVSAGVVTITAAIEGMDNYTATCTVTVLAGSVPTISLNKSEAALSVYQTLYLAADVQNVTDPAPVYSVTGDAVTLRQNGLAATVTAVKEGQATVTVTLTLSDGSTKTASCAITVAFAADAVAGFGQKAWAYGAVDYGWDPERILSFTDLPVSGDGYADASGEHRAELSGDALALTGNFTALRYTAEKSGTFRILATMEKTGEGEPNEGGEYFAVRFRHEVTLGGDKALFDRGFHTVTTAAPRAEYERIVTLKAGEAFYIVVTAPGTARTLALTLRLTRADGTTVDNATDRNAFTGRKAADMAGWGQPNLYLTGVADDAAVWDADTLTLSKKGGMLVYVNTSETAVTVESQMLFRYVDPSPDNEAARPSFRVFKLSQQGYRTNDGMPDGFDRTGRPTVRTQTITLQPGEGIAAVLWDVDTGIYLDWRVALLA